VEREEGEGEGGAGAGAGGGGGFSELRKSALLRYARVERARVIARPRYSRFPFSRPLEILLIATPHRGQSVYMPVRVDGYWQADITET
jgi:hypothetical protein